MERIQIIWGLLHLRNYTDSTSIQGKKEGTDRLERANIPEGWWACEFHGNCRRVCPKGVPPLIAIAKAREQLNDINEKKEEEP